MSMRIAVIGLSITSSWGNGHATTFRSLLRALSARRHRVLFLEWNAPWYASHRDMPSPTFCQAELYADTADLQQRFADEVRAADVVLVGSYVNDGIEVARWVLETARGITAFYDVDTPITLAALRRGDCAYLDRLLVPYFDLYLSFTGGPALEELNERYSARRPRPLYCSVDPDLYRPEPTRTRWDLGYMGTYSADRQPKLEEMLLATAKRLPSCRFAVAGPQYPPGTVWPLNVERFEHLAPADHADFYRSQRFTLNLTRADMIALGWSPSVRLFEAAACGTAIISDRWQGIDSFFKPGAEILLAETSDDVSGILDGMSEHERRAIGEAARERVLASHTAAERAAELEQYVEEAAMLPSQPAIVSTGQALNGRI